MMSNSSSELTRGILVCADPAPLTQRPIDRSFTDNPVRTPHVCLPSTQQATAQTLSSGSRSSASEANIRSIFPPVDHTSPGLGIVTLDRQNVRATSSQNQSSSNEDQSDLAKTTLSANIHQVLHWIRMKKSNSLSTSISPVLEDELVSLRGTDQVRTPVLITSMY
jgi:hypothetical protein